MTLIYKYGGNKATIGNTLYENFEYSLVRDVLFITADMVETEWFSYKEYRDEENNEIFRKARPEYIRKDEHGNEYLEGEVVFKEEYNIPAKIVINDKFKIFDYSDVDADAHNRK